MAAKRVCPPPPSASSGTRVVIPKGWYRLSQIIAYPWRQSELRIFSRVTLLFCSFARFSFCGCVVGDTLWPFFFLFLCSELYPTFQGYLETIRVLSKRLEEKEEELRNKEDEAKKKEQEMKKTIGELQACIAHLEERSKQLEAEVKHSLPLPAMRESTRSCNSRKGHQKRRTAARQLLSELNGSLPTSFQIKQVCFMHAPVFFF